MIQKDEKYIKDDQINNKVKEFCYNCNNITNHIVKTSYKLDSEEYEFGEWSISRYSSFQVIQCQGCESLSFRNEIYNSEDMEFDDSGVNCEGKFSIIYPSRSVNDLTVKSFSHNIPSELNLIYKQTIDCINNESYLLAAAGLRVLIEGLCASLGIEYVKRINKKGKEFKKKDLEGKIEGLHEKGFLTKNNASILHKLRFLGNVAVHELVIASKKELVLAVQIIENALETIYEIPSKGRILKFHRGE